MSLYAALCRKLDFDEDICYTIFIVKSRKYPVNRKKIFKKCNAGIKFVVYIDRAAMQGNA